MRPNRSYQIIAPGDLNGLVLQINSALNEIADRLDKIEGLRDTLETGKADFDGDITVKGKVIVTDSSGKIHSME